MRVVLNIVLVALLGALAAGCGSSTATSERKFASATPLPAGRGNTANANTTAGTSGATARTIGVGADAYSRCGLPKASPTCDVLFIGNSYTYVNNLPAMLTGLAKAGHHPIETGIEAAGGATLADHASSPETTTALNSARWNFVVLQEQSQIPSVERLRQTHMYPAVRQLVRMARNLGAQPMFYLTPAQRGGWPERNLDGYASMQSAIDEGYLVIARELHAAVAPVGYAWAAALSHEAPSSLWQRDGSHPTVKATYLTACVFYAAVFGESPKWLRYHAGLSDRDAAKLQAIASHVVFGDLAKWGLR